MRQRRSETFAERYGNKTIEDILRETTFGGTKYGEGRISKQMPILSKGEGIKMQWDTRSGEYPSVIWLQMTDGQWMTYTINVEQPGFTAAMDIIRNPAYKCGYPLKR